jgi:hypothetical protein
MTDTAGEAAEALRGRMTGPVITPDDRSYDDARRLWNGDADGRPAVIACCMSRDDVAAAVDVAQANGLEISVRGGAHSFSGASAGDDGLMIHLGAMNGVAVDPQHYRARVGGGATWADVDAATQAHGLAVTGGLVGHTGVGGLTLGGGMGWLANRHGYTVDNLESAEVVLADGRIVRASESDHPDLFWALRGGGGNFGVVTEFEFRLHPVGPDRSSGRRMTSTPPPRSTGWRDRPHRRRRPHPPRRDRMADPAGGLAIDNLVSVEIFVADGRILRASETEHPDLFWAVRGEAATSVWSPSSSSGSTTSGRSSTSGCCSGARTRPVTRCG